MTQDLIERALAGDETAARKLHQDHYPAALRLAYMLLKNLQDAEDAVQNAFIYAFDSLERYDAERGAFATWINVIVTSRCRDLQRKRRFRWISLQRLLDLGHEPADEQRAHHPQVMLELTGLQRSVWQALDQVPAKSREALILRYYGDLSYPEMGRALDCPVSTAKSRVVYGLKKLTQLLESEAESLLGYPMGDVR